MNEGKESKNVIGVNDVYREAYYRLKERNQVLENRCLHLESSTTKFKERAKGWLNNLETAMMVAQQLVIAQSQTVYANACMNETYHNIKKQAKHCEESVKEVVLLKASIGQNWPSVQKISKDIQTVEYQLQEEKRMNNKLAKHCDALEKEKEENPQYQKLYRKIGNLEVKLKQQIQSNKLLTRDVKQAESKLEIASTEAKKEQQKAASFRDKMKKMEGEEATGEREKEKLESEVKTLSERVKLLRRDMRRKDNFLSEKEKQDKENQSVYRQRETENTDLKRRLVVLERQLQTAKRENSLLRKKHVEEEKNQELTEELEKVKLQKVHQVEENRMQKESIVLLQRKLAVLRVQLNDSALRCAQLEGEIEIEREHALSANAAAVVAATRLSYERQKGEFPEFVNFGDSDTKSVASSTLDAKEPYKDPVEFGKSLRVNNLEMSLD